MRRFKSVALDGGSDELFSNESSLVAPRHYRRWFGSLLQLPPSEGLVGFGAENSIDRIGRRVSIGESVSMAVKHVYAGENGIVDGRGAERPAHEAGTGQTRLRPQHVGVCQRRAVSEGSRVRPRVVGHVGGCGCSRRRGSGGDRRSRGQIFDRLQQAPHQLVQLSSSAARRGRSLTAPGRTDAGIHGGAQGARRARRFGRRCAPC